MCFLTLLSRYVLRATLNDASLMEHWLISKIISSTVTDGWLNLVVTDYTTHRLVSSSGANGQQVINCSTSQVDEPTRAKLTAGTFWSLQNVRLKFGDTGYLEMDLYAAKYRKLYRNQNPMDSHLVELLK